MFDRLERCFILRGRVDKYSVATHLAWTGRLYECSITIELVVRCRKRDLQASEYNNHGLNKQVLTAFRNRLDVGEEGGSPSIPSVLLGLRGVGSCI